MSYHYHLVPLRGDFSEAFQHDPIDFVTDALMILVNEISEEMVA